ncbi:conserved hypothetical protein [Paraburkholderia atlantica]|uniref:Tlde1 domain-containing protein n=1 Tax=Paraburkholderia atlantica TaxID=2654982 RepID=D5WGC4_PARAM|nr:tlde1 domain-containing protein [Paraburkholderia atlantica]ADG17543.1 conserved hypothetical protein [Paraburkholderia atlantica]
MVWTYSQKSGQLWHNDAPIAGGNASGYSGKGAGKNNPIMQAKSSTGPIPRGEYRITEPFNHAHAGRYTLRLEPAIGTQTFGRSGFMIHGDSLKNPGNASEGCIIFPLLIRQRIWNSGDTLLEVVQ